MEEIIVSDLQACVNSVGSRLGDSFERVRDTNVSIRDILRHLRRESSKCEIRLELGKMNVLQRCLIPLLKYHYNDSVLFDLIIRLMMNLTQPAFICFKQQLPEDMLMRRVYIKVNKALQEYQLIFTDKAIFQVLADYLNGIFAKEWEDRSEEDHMMVERVLILLRNLLHINSTDLEKVMDGSFSRHDKVLEAMLNGGWSEVLCYLSNTDEEHRFAFHTLEIVSLMFKEQSAESLKQGKDNKEENNERLLHLVKLDEDLQNNSRAKLNLRGLRYDGVFELTNIKSSTGLPMVYHHDLSSGKIDLKRNRKLQHRPKNRVQINEQRYEHKSPRSLVEMLREFCKLFLLHGYNILMSTARNYLVRNQMQPDDETYYLWSLKFFMAVCRINKLNPDFVNETLTEEVFYWVYEQVITNMDAAETDKKKARGYYRKIELTIEAYNEMLRFLLILDKHPNDKYKRLSAHIKSRVFYQAEYLDLYPMLLQKYKENVQSILLLSYLIDGSHLVITILQNHKAFDMNVVCKRVKKKKKSKNKKSRAALLEEIPIASDSDDLNIVWHHIYEEVILVVKDEALISDMNLPCIYDPTFPDKQEPIEPGGEPIDAQLKKALGFVQIYLRQEKPQLAVAVLRLARTLWPEEAMIALSPEQDSSEQEVSMLKLLLLVPKFYTDEDLDIVKSTAIEIQQNISNEVEEEAEYMEDEFVTLETFFDLNTYLLKFTEPNIVKTYGILFNEFKFNPPPTKSSLLRIMHQIGVKMKLPMALYNLRTFAAFSNFLKDPLSKTSHFKEERKFVNYIIKCFCKHAEENRKLFVEVLFQKNTKHLMSILIGEKYEREDKSQRWTVDLDEELIRLYEEVQREEVLPGFDKVDMIMNRFSEPNKTRRQICRRLITLDIIESLEDIVPKRKRRENPWSADEEARLIVLVEEYRNEQNAIKFIMNGMVAAVTDPSMIRAKRHIVKKILELGLVSMKEELGIVNRRRKDNNVDDPEEGSDQETSDEDEAEEKFVVSREKRIPPPLKQTKIIDWTAFKMTFARLQANEQRWFIDLMVDNIDTRANGIVGSLALIPLLDEDSAALSSQCMQKLLTICTFLYPNSFNGEDFWRIPEDMGVRELDNFRHCAASLSEADLFALTMTETEQSIKPRPKKTVLQEINILKNELFGSDSEEEFEYKEREGSRSSAQEDEDEEDKSVSYERSKKHALIESEDSEEDDVRLNRNNKRRIIDSEDDEENASGPISKKRTIIEDESD